MLQEILNSFTDKFVFFTSTELGISIIMFAMLFAGVYIIISWVIKTARHALALLASIEIETAKQSLMMRTSNHRHQKEIIRRAAYEAKMLLATQEIADAQKSKKAPKPEHIQPGTHPLGM